MTDTERIRNALSCIPATDRDTWLRMGMAVKSEIGDAGFDLWDAWSQQANSYDASDARDVWRSIHANGKVTAGTLFHEAKKNGWSDNGIRHKPTPEELAERSRIATNQTAEEEAERKAAQETAAEKAATIWNGAEEAPADHRYFLNKHIKPYGLRAVKGLLIVPMRDTTDELHNLQFIKGDGTKKFLAGGRVSGHYFGIGAPDGVLCITEGYATAASVHEATGHAVAVAFNAGNLLPVAKELRSKFPDVRLILCADDDHRTAGNPGITKATEAARAVGGLLAVPDFGESRPDDASDFNDLHQQHGAKAVQRAVANAQPPAIPEQQPTTENAPANDSASEFVTYRQASSIEAKPISWLWPGRIAKGKVSMIAGNPGLGKSQVTASMAAIVSTGGLWPVDRVRAEQGSVVILSAEDDAADTIVPRLHASGADTTRVLILDAVREVNNGKTVERGFNLRIDLSKLGAMLAGIGDVALVVIDPVTAYLGDTDSHKNAEVRALLAPLSDLAAAHGVAVVCVSHLNKGNSNDALMRVMGSLAFVAAARAAWIVAKDPENERRRLFLPAKNNIGNDLSGLAFSIESAGIDSPAGMINTSAVAWETDAVSTSVNDVVGSQNDGDNRSAISEAKDFLAGLLADGPLPAKQIKADASGAGFTWRTIHRAADRLKVERRKEGMRGGWTWQLPPKVPKDAEDATVFKVAPSGNVGTFGDDGQHFEEIEI
jgi:putative DNA primase/helicase